MKTLKLLTVTMLLLVAMAAGAGTISNVYVGNLVCSFDTDTKVATVTGYYGNEPTDLVIPNTIGYSGGNYSVTTIGDEAFSSCNSLASINIPNSVTTIGRWAFSYCKSLASVTIGESVTTIGKETFASCYSLASVNIPNSVTTIGNSAFQYCHSLASVDIPPSVTTIGHEAFAECNSLASINIPNSVTTIRGEAFYDCTSLASVTIGESVTTIFDGAFDDCYAITSVICLAKKCPVYKRTMYDMFSVYKKATLYVPKQSIDAYKTTYPWSNFVNVVALEDTGIEGKPMDNAPRADAVYDIDGRRTDSMKRGLNIVRMSDGTTRKVMK